MEVQALERIDDHLSDRELYTLLWSDLLPQQMDALDEDTTWHIDILGGCSEEDLQLRLKYYADDDFRDCWAKEWPDDELPPRDVPGAGL